MNDEAARPTLQASRFRVFPAIDLRGGRVVRLAQGDPARQTVYADDPRTVAERWKAEGAEWAHVVNLDGAFGDEASANLPSLISILAAGLKVQFGGGLRDQASLRRVMEAGGTGAGIGTAAVTAVELGQRLRAHGVTWCVFTDVARDGVGAGVNVAASAELARETGLLVIAAGGVAGIEDV